MPATETNIECIEELDFDFAPPCEHSMHGIAPWHSGPAFYLIKAVTPCGCINRVFYICKGGYEQASANLICTGCCESFPKREVWTVLSTVN